LELQLQLDNGTCASVDLGQLAGHRYTFRHAAPGALTVQYQPHPP
jgi:hypothetical protein